MTMAHANPTGDDIIISIQGTPAGSNIVDAEVGPGLEYDDEIGFLPTVPLTVDINGDDAEIWINLPEGFSQLSGPFSVHIIGIDWLENGVQIEGAIVGVECDFPSGVGGVTFTSDTIVVTLPSGLPAPFEVHCEFFAHQPDFLVIDQDSIHHEDPPNFFEEEDVNAGIADIGLRTQLPFFAANIGQTITLHTGEVGDEGWFAPKTIPSSWDAAGPTANGIRNYLMAGPGLGSGEDPEALLDKIPDVTPLRATGLKMLEEKQVCAVVYDSDISINYDPLDGSLKGDNLGIIAFEVISVTELTGTEISDKSLPKVDIEILDAGEVCVGPLELFTDAPEPTSSSEPSDVKP